MAKTRTTYHRIPRAVVLFVALGLFCSGFNDAQAAGSESRPEGFGRATTGGAGGATYWVTQLGDRGPGSLRAGAERTDATVVRFRVSGTIRLESHLMVGPNKTIEGQGARVTISRRGFVLEEPNVIVRNLTFANIGDLRVEDDEEDAILIRGAHDVWIDHCTMMRAGDKLIGVPAGNDITVSRNHFLDQRQVLQVGTVSTAEASRGTRVTVHHNYFDGTADRHPHVSYGKIHAYNNYVRDWGVKGMSALRGAQLFSDSNIFAAGTNRKAITFDAVIAADKDDFEGFVRSRGDLALNRAVIQQNRPQRVFDPSRYYEADVQRATRALADTVRSAAGVQD